MALTAGSRGIANIPVVLRAVVRYLRDLGAQPFLVPAMGSHGGGTAEGQRQVLESYGITEAFVGAPIRASMDVVSLGTTADGFPVVLDRHASEADHIGVVARIKPHTSYHGPIESGLLKMMMIGLGKHAGALTYHRLLLDHPYDQVVRSVGRLMRAKARSRSAWAWWRTPTTRRHWSRRPCPVTSSRSRSASWSWLGAGCRGCPCARPTCSSSTRSARRSAARAWTPTWSAASAPSPRMEPEGQPQMRFIFVRGLSAHTHGNAAGIGFADFTTTRLVRAMNYQATVLNCLTAGYPGAANLPVHFDSDREVIDAALAIVGTRAVQDARILHIRNTLAVEDVEVSEPCLDQADRQTDFTIESGPYELTFDGQGNLAGL